MGDVLLQLDGTGSIYLQIHRAIATAIKSGVIHPGTRLPSSRDLAARFRVSRNTVVHALELLQDDGLVESNGAAGSIVVAQKQHTERIPPAASPEGMPASEFHSRVMHLRARAFPSRVASPMFDLVYGEPYVNPALFTTLAASFSIATRNLDGRYVGPQGFLPLRHEIAAYLGRRRGLACSADDVVIVGGTQQALDLLAKLFVDAGDTIAMEEPRYERAYQCMKAHGADIHCLPVDGEGMTLGGLASIQPALAFVTPAHQFPTGIRMSNARRRDLLDLSRGSKFWVVEDDYDGEFDIGPNASPALKAQDVHRTVIYVGSFSKTLFPTLRLGYVIAPPAIVNAMTRAKSLADLETSGVDQMALAHFMRTGSFDRHLRRVSRELMDRRTGFEEGLRDVLPHVNLSGRSAMHCTIWLNGATEDDVRFVIEYAAKRQVGLHSVAPHYQEAAPVQGLLVGFARHTAKQLRAAGRIIAGAIREAGIDGRARDRTNAVRQ